MQSSSSSDLFLFLDLLILLSYYSFLFTNVSNGALANANIPKDYKNDTIQCLLKPVLNMSECSEML